MDYEDHLTIMKIAKEREEKQEIAIVLAQLKSLKALLGVDSPEVRGWAPAVQESAQSAINRAIETVQKLEHKQSILPADWEVDSSLETWFPMSARQLFDTTERAEQLRQQCENLLRVERAARQLYEETEEYDFPDGMGKGAIQQYWDELDTALEQASNAQPTGPQGPRGATS